MGEGEGEGDQENAPSHQIFPTLEALLAHHTDVSVSLVVVSPCLMT